MIGKTLKHPQQTDCADSICFLYQISRMREKETNDIWLDARWKLEIFDDFHCHQSASLLLPYAINTRSNKKQFGVHTTCQIVWEKPTTQYSYPSHILFRMSWGLLECHMQFLAIRNKIKITSFKCTVKFSRIHSTNVISYLVTAHDRSSFWLIKFRLKTLNVCIFTFTVLYNEENF